jgi:hypothetical protein
MDTVKSTIVYAVSSVITLMASGAEYGLPELWDVATNRWMSGPTGEIRRAYHHASDPALQSVCAISNGSLSLLAPNATVHVFRVLEVGAGGQVGPLQRKSIVKRAGTLTFIESDDDAVAFLNGISGVKTPYVEALLRTLAFAELRGTPVAVGEVLKREWRGGYKPFSGDALVLSENSNGIQSEVVVVVESRARSGIFWCDKIVCEFGSQDKMRIRSASEVCRIGGYK